MGRHGENIRKRKDGRWEARVISSYKPDGKAIYRSVYGKTYLEAKEKRNDLLRSTAAISSRCEKAGSSKGKITLEEVAWEWLAALGKDIPIWRTPQPETEDCEIRRIQVSLF